MALSVNLHAKQVTHGSPEVEATELFVHGELNPELQKQLSALYDGAVEDHVTGKVQNMLSRHQSE